MDESVEDQGKASVGTRLFVGCAVTPEIGMALSQSTQWSRDQTLGTEGGTALVKTRFRDKEFMGLFLDKEQPTLPLLEDCEKQIKKSLREYCPELAVEGFAVVVFPQIFLS